VYQYQSEPNVQSLFLYPIKSCAGIQVDSLNLLSYGPQYDRQFVVVDEKTGEALTQREYPRLCLVRTSFQAPFNRGPRQLNFQVPGVEPFRIPLEREVGEEREAVVWGDVCRGLDEGNVIAEAFSDFLGKRCRLVRYLPKNPRLRMSHTLGATVSISFADAYPILVVSSASLDDLNRRIGGEPLNMNRFRPNVVIGNTAPYAEDQWSAISVGDVLLRGANQCVRCVTTLVDQDTGKLGKEPLRMLKKYRRIPDGVIFARNFIILRHGIIRMGEVVSTP